MKLRIVAAIVGALLAAPIAAAPQAYGEETNAAVAVNEKDGSSVFKISFQIKKVMDGDVDSQNAAVAYSNCNDCQTVAVAIQIILVVGEAESATPTNIAVAINENCQSCETMAAAYQYVFGTGDNFKFSEEGKRRLRELRKRVHDLRKRDDMSLEQIQAELDVITSEIADVLENELRASEEPTATTTTTTDPVESTTTSTTADRDDEVSTTTSTP